MCNLYLAIKININYFVHNIADFTYSLGYSLGYYLCYCLSVCDLGYCTINKMPPLCLTASNKFSTSAC